MERRLRLDDRCTGLEIAPVNQAGHGRQIVMRGELKARKRHGLCFWTEKRLTD